MYYFRGFPSYQEVFYLLLCHAEEYKTCLMLAFVCYKGQTVNKYQQMIKALDTEVRLPTMVVG